MTPEGRFTWPPRSFQIAGRLRAGSLWIALIASPTLHSTAQAQAPLPSPSSPLTLDDAEKIAIRNQPRLLAAQLRARESLQRVLQVQSAFRPSLAFNATGVRVVDVGTSLASGNLTTSAVSNRFSYGGGLTQLVTDFGRTSALVGSARSDAEAQADLATLSRARVRLNVREAYYQVLGAESVLRAAQAAQTNRHLIAHQLGALAQSELRSTVDANFAEVLASEADLAVVRAESMVARQRAHLATALGATQTITALLVDPPTPDALPASPDALLAEAQQKRADVQAAHARQAAAQHLADAEHRLRYPTLAVLGSAGQIPFHDRTLQGDFAAAGFNLNIPILNGGLFAARQHEAEIESTARSRDVLAVHLEVTEQVRDSWLQAQEASQSLAVTGRLVTQSKEALRLAQARYDAGLGSIVELNEAQLNETSAEISAADAVYADLARRADLDFAAGLLN